MLLAVKLPEIAFAVTVKVATPLVVALPQGLLIIHLYLLVEAATLGFVRVNVEVVAPL